MKFRNELIDRKVSNLMASFKYDNYTHNEYISDIESSYVFKPRKTISELHSQIRIKNPSPTQTSETSNKDKSKLGGNDLIKSKLKDIHSCNQTLSPSTVK